jgi:hypothetical protein
VSYITLDEFDHWLKRSEKARPAAKLYRAPARTAGCASPAPEAGKPISSAGSRLAPKSI